MIIEIHQSELEALIQQRMDSGHFQNVEDVLMQALKFFPEPEKQPTLRTPKKNFAQFLKESPLWQSGLELKRNKDFQRPIEL